MAVMSWAELKNRSEGFLPYPKKQRWEDALERMGMPISGKVEAPETVGAGVSPDIKAEIERPSTQNKPISTKEKETEGTFKKIPGLGVMQAGKEISKIGDILAGKYGRTPDLLKGFIEKYEKEKEVPDKIKDKLDKLDKDKRDFIFSRADKHWNDAQSRITRKTVNQYEKVKSAVDLIDPKDKSRESIKNQFAAMTAMFMFISGLDDSVVRQSEINMGMQQGGLVEWFKNMKNQVEGRGSLTPKNAREIEEIARVVLQSSIDLQRDFDEGEKEKLRRFGYEEFIPFVVNDRQYKKYATEPPIFKERISSGKETWIEYTIPGTDEVYLDTLKNFNANKKEGWLIHGKPFEGTGDEAAKHFGYTE